MNCREARELLGPLADGELNAEKARELGDHLAGCNMCAAGLDPSQWVEVLPALDDRIEPSGDFAVRFQEKLSARRQSWLGKIAGLGWPRQLAAAGALATLVLAGVFVVRPPKAPQDSAAYLAESGVAEKLPFLEDMAVVSNLDLLEDFETIENLPRLMKEADKN